MAYEAITDNDIVVGRPTKRSLWQKIKGNFEHLFSIAVEGGLKNGSFETDTDEDGIPDNWTRSLYPGGSGGFDTSAPIHGARAYYFTHPGGGGNGGGYLESDYVDVSSLDRNSIKLNIRSSVTGIKNIVQVRYFDKDKVFLSSADLYNATAPDTNARSLSYSFTPPASARYIKIRLIGGYTDTDVAGSTYFDGVQLSQAVDGGVTPGNRFFCGAVYFYENNTLQPTKRKEIVIGFRGTLRIKFSACVNGSSGDPTNAHGQIYRNGEAVGTLRTTNSLSWTEYSEDIAGWEVGDLLQLYVYEDRTDGGRRGWYRGFAVYIDDASFAVAIGGGDNVFQPTLNGLVTAADDAAAASAGVPVGAFYRNGSAVMIRVA